VAAALSLAIGGRTALLGALLGLAVAAVLCGVSAALVARARRSENKNALLAALLGGIAASFAIMIFFLVILAYLRRDLLAPAALSAVGAYLTYRFAEALEVSRIESTRAAESRMRPPPGDPALAVGRRP